MPIFLITTIIFVIILNIALNRQNKSFHNTYEKELKKSNIYKSKPFPENFFIQKKLNDYSFIKSDKKSIEMFVNNLSDMQKNKIIKPNEDLTNYHLKITYGVDNLSTLSTYERNYREYIYTLNSLAKALIDNELYENAIKVLDEAIYCKSNMSVTYSLYYTAMKNLNSNYYLADLRRNKAINDILQNDEYILKKLQQLK